MGLTGSAEPEVVMQRGQQLAQEVGYDPAQALLTVQEHGANVVTFHRRRAEGGQCVLSTDALATDLPGQAVLSYHADCFPLLFLDRTRGVVAGAHAGWRGSLAGVGIETVRALQRGYGTRSDQLDVLVGPGICRRCYQVGWDVAEQFQARFGGPGRYLEVREDGVQLDLEGVLRLQLEGEGVAPDRIQTAGWCTREDQRWFSHRGGRPGRFLSAVVAP